MPLLYGFGDGPASTQAAWRKSSIWLSQLAIWFQLPGVGDASLRSMVFPELRLGKPPICHRKRRHCSATSQRRRLIAPKLGNGPSKRRRTRSFFQSQFERIVLELALLSQKHSEFGEPQEVDALQPSLSWLTLIASNLTLRTAMSTSGVS